MSERMRTGTGRGNHKGPHVSNVDHICTVEHTYGPHGEHTWVKPICGAPAGRATSSWTDRLCERCQKIDAKTATR